MSNSKQRGRPKGANSFVKVSMTDLAKIVGPQSSVVVSKIWLRDLGAAVTESDSVSIPAVAETPPEQSKIEFAVTTFED